MWTKCNKFLGATTMLVALCWTVSSAAVDLREGTNYKRLQNPQPVETGDKVEVIEFFSYGCPHCAHFEPILNPWVKKLPADVQFRRVPAMFQPGWTDLARGYYTLDIMGQGEKLSPAVFDAVHKETVNLKQDTVFFDWAAKHGLERQKVADIYSSFAVNSKLSRAKSQAQSYH